MDCDAEVALAIDHLLHAIDFFPHVHELSASAALNCHGHHQVYSVFAVLRLSIARDERRIEVRRIILV